MNDHRLPPDEAASAFLDGELGAEEAEAVRRHPRLAARARALRRAAEAVGEDVTPPPGAADAAVEAAMADFDARRSAAAEPAQRRPRSLSVITGVAAAVAIGFIVAAAVVLFAERGADDVDTAAAPHPPPADAEAAAVAPEPAPAPAPAFPPPAAEGMAMERAPATTSTQTAALAPPPATTAPPAADAPQVAAVEPGAALAEAQAQADVARAEAETPGTEAADTPAAQAAAAVAEPAAEPAPPPPEPAPPPADEMEALDDAGPPAAALADAAPEEACAGAIGDGTVELRLTLADTRIFVVRASDGSLSALDGTTCAEIPPPDGTEMVADAAPDGCAGAIGDGTVEMRLTFNGTRILVVRASDGSLSALDGTTCGGIPAG